MSVTLHQQLLSLKAREYFSSNVHYVENENKKLCIQLDQSDNFLTLGHGHSSNSLECLMIEGLIALCLNKPLKILWNIEYKEFESYLRDENHLPALPHDKAFVESFNRMREELILESLKQVITHRPELNYPQDVSNFVTLNRWGQNFCRFLGHELILLDEGILTYKVNPLGMRERDLDFVIKSSSQIRTNWPMLKVVAVS